MQSGCIVIGSMSFISCASRPWQLPGKEQLTLRASAMLVCICMTGASSSGCCISDFLRCMKAHCSFCISLHPDFLPDVTAADASWHVHDTCFESIASTSGLRHHSMKRPPCRLCSNKVVCNHCATFCIFCPGAPLACKAARCQC